jgi:Tfp pilus assembly protein PilF
MRRVHIISILLAAALLAASSQPWLAASAVSESRDAAALVGGGRASLNDNAFGRALKAPFKAIGRLFGGGKEKDKAKEKAKAETPPPKGFESAPAVRVQDSSVSAPTAKKEGETAAELLARGRELLATGSLNEAVAVLSRAASLDPSLAEAHDLLGVALDRKGLAQTAQQSFTRALDLAPKDARALNNYGYYLYRQGEYKEAVKYLKRAAKLAPADEQVWNNLGLAQFRRGKYADAYRSFARAVGEFRALMSTGNMLELAGRDEEAYKYFEEAHRLDPASRAALQHLADVCQRLGKLKEAAAARYALQATPPPKAGVSGGGS